MTSVCLKGNSTTNLIEEILLVEHFNARDKYTTTLPVNNTEVTFENDSGAAVSLMSEEYARRLFKGTTLFRTQTKLVSYCNTQINVIGFIKVEVKFANQIFNLHLYLTTNKRPPLLGREWMKAMLKNGNANQLFADVSQITESNTMAADRKKIIENLLKQYSNCTKTGMGKIKGITATLKLKENAQPVFLKPRPAAFRLITLLDKEIERLVKEGILIKVNSEKFATPIVPVLKWDGTIRMCGDYSVTLNPNLIIDEHPLPTPVDMFASVKDSKHLAKIDLHQAYMQMKVDDASSALLTINTHRVVRAPGWFS